MNQSLKKRERSEERSFSPFDEEESSKKIKKTTSTTVAKTSVGKGKGKGKGITKQSTTFQKPKNERGVDVSAFFQTDVFSNPTEHELCCQAISFGVYAQLSSFNQYYLSWCMISTPPPVSTPQKRKNIEEEENEEEIPAPSYNNNPLLIMDVAYFKAVAKYMGISNKIEDVAYIKALYEFGAFSVYYASLDQLSLAQKAFILNLSWGKSTIFATSPSELIHLRMMAMTHESFAKMIASPSFPGPHEHINNFIRSNSSELYQRDFSNKIQRTFEYEFNAAYLLGEGGGGGGDVANNLISKVQTDPEFFSLSKYNEILENTTKATAVEIKSPQKLDVNTPHVFKITSSDMIKLNTNKKRVQELWKYWASVKLPLSTDHHGERLSSPSYRLLVLNTIKKVNQLLQSFGIFPSNPKYFKNMDALDDMTVIDNDISFVGFSYFV